MFEDVYYKDVRKHKDVVYIDVRSPSEYEESTIPGAVNVPLFNDEERAEVGTTYKKVGREQAKELGLQIASRKLPDLISQIRKYADERKPVIFCWRGGMRSKSVATVADLMGIPCYRLIGGYRQYRSDVVERLGNYELKARLVTLHGMTGVGKTEILGLLHAAGEPVIDLEALAGHRGSTFGHFGLKPNNQRMFESLLVEELERLQDQPYIIMEAESKRIGRVNLPDFLLEKRNEGIHFMLHAPLHIRIERILKQYLVGTDDFHEKVSQSLRAIEKKLSPQNRSLAWQYIEERQYADFVGLLLVHYYDPRYKHSLQKYDVPFIQVDSTDLFACAKTIKELIHENSFVHPSFAK
jgi:tRNA 2-selenouridine synthase